MKHEIFVFGSNEAGRHGKGAALFAAKHHGAIYGQGYGLQGNSFAIPTKDKDLKVLSLDAIQAYVNMFLDFAATHQDCIFMVTPIGTGLAGYALHDIMRLFRRADFGVPSNVVFTKEWFNL